MAGYIHDDVKEIMEEAAEQKSADSVLPSTVGWSEAQLKSLDIMLQYAWNRGYKSASNDLSE